MLNYSKFNKQDFIKKIFDKSWENKELKQRMRHISKTMFDFLPQNYYKSIDILKKTFSNLNSKYVFENMIFQDYVEVFGINDFEISMDALMHFTIGSSSEFAVRQFILKYEKETMQQMKIWAKHKNHHIRRLASEGCRPRLPWSLHISNFKKNPDKVLEILEILKDDKSEYVRKSVANNLNDISKDNPQIIRNIAKKWINFSVEKNKIIKHGCRTLLKNGDKEILNLFGFHEKNELKLEFISVDKIVKMGEKLNFSFVISSKEKLGKLRICYAIDFLLQKNKYGQKIFKISEGIFKENNKEFSKFFSFKKITTRKYYKGKHKLTIIVNGVKMIKKDFLVN